MPTYLYVRCSGDPEDTEERNVPIDDRDLQLCNRCHMKLDRKIAFTGLTWAPSSTNGYMR